jgi:heat shock protein HtpX
MSNWFIADYILFRHLPVRKPILSEEQKLEKLFAPVVQQTAFIKKVRLRITEEMELDAFAIGQRTIAISRKMLETFSDDELQGVMAHELGHLQDRDCLVGAAFEMATALPFPFYFKLPVLIKKKQKKYIILRPLIKIFRVMLLIFLLILFFNSYYRHRVIIFIVVALCFILFPRITKIFDLFWRTVTRFIEYKQDAHAHKLGFGDGLRKALERSISENGERVNLYENMMKFDHPVIYNRIRRLEKLSGLRS